MAKAERLPAPARLTRAFGVLRRPLKLDHTFEREVFFLAAVGFSAFYLTSLATFSPTDTSWIAATHPPLPAQNLAGSVGATLSGLAYFAFGATSWILPLPLLMTAWLILRNSPTAASRSRLAGWSLFIACVAALAATRLSPLKIKGFELPSGGYVGARLASALLKELGQVGSLVTVATVIACSVLLVMRKSVIHPLWSFAKGYLPKISLPSFSLPFTKKSGVEGETPAETAPASVSDRVATPVFTEPLFTPEPAVGAPAAAPAPIVDLSTVPLMSSDDEIPAPAEDDEFYEPPRRVHTPSSYAPPPLTIFNKSDPTTQTSANLKELEFTANLLVKTFLDFGIEGKIIGYQPGPVVTVFEFQPDAGVKQSKVLSLIDDLALALKVDSIFIHPVKGKSALGIQVPNTRREAVYFGDIVNSAAFRDAESPLTFGMGKNINGQPMCADLASMPHLLTAGATGSGKSVAINAFLCSVIMKASPDDVRMILVDPKMLELSVYEGIPHLLMPVITEPEKASLALKWATHEMERRYKLMQLAAVRNLAGFNAFVEKASPARLEALSEASGEEVIHKLPYILLVIDELADLMMTAPKDVESSIQRLAQKARASGIHMVLATQRPSVDVITGVIKANLPCRIAFQVVSKHDSRTILDLIGADKLLGKGDFLLQRPGIGRLERVQGAFISDDEVINLVAEVKKQGLAKYDDSIISWIDDEFARQKSGKDSGSDDLDMMEDDARFGEALNLARTHGVVSASFLQRHLKIGYNRAARMVEFMEQRGLVDKADGAKPRKWLGPMA